MVEKIVHYYKDIISKARQFLLISSYIIEDEELATLIAQKVQTLPQGVWILTDLRNEIIDRIDIRITNISTPEGYQRTDERKKACLRMLAIALWILENHFPAIAQNQEFISHLIQYLQKISFFRSIQPYVNQGIFEIIVEILYQDRVFYKKVIVSVSAIANIIESQIKSVFPRNA